MSYKHTKILDCTLRDGGYYTNWDFAPEVVASYIEAMNQLPIDYIELGYRNNPGNEYLGCFGYSPVSVLRKIRERCTKKIVLMLNEKSTRVDDLNRILGPIQGLVDMIRLAIDPKNFDRAVTLAENVKRYGFEVGFNVMYMSKWNEYEDFLPSLSKINGIADLFCMVDSFGGVSPDVVRETLHTVRQVTTCPIGFHGHNNLQLGLINTLTAIEEEVDYVDATILGMGRGAGNLNMELLLTYLNTKGLEVDFNVLSEVISAFMPLYHKYQWGTNLPYMLSGANSIPQKEVMAWVSNRAYSFNSIVRALNNRKSNQKDNAKYPELEIARKYEQVLIVGGGENVVAHLDGILDFIRQHPDIALVFATARFVECFQAVQSDKYYCLVGNEAKRLAKNTHNQPFAGKCVLPPYPRLMGTEVPEHAQHVTYELPSLDFTTQYLDSCTTIAIQLALNLADHDIFVVGYDGYPGNILSEKEVDLTNENRAIFESYARFTGAKLKSLTPSLYKDLNIVSLYQFI
jgi:4-hydroxy 2-oxovalerate aldolase